MRAQNRHDTKRWKIKRKNHFADRCRRANCGLCSPHKTLGNNRNAVKAKYYRKNESLE